MTRLTDQINESLHDQSSRKFVRFNILLAIVTIISITSIIFETVASLHYFHSVFLIIEWASVIFFTFEYLARIYTTNEKRKYVFSFWGIADILSIIPTFFSLGNWTFLKSVRILRILRLLRLLRLIKIIHIYTGTLRAVDSQEEINKQNIILYFFTLATGVLLSGAVLYTLEHNQKAYENIPLSMLQGAKLLVGGLAIALPQTIGGEIAVVVIRFIGLALFGLLIAIVGGALNQLIFGDKKN